MYVSARWSGSRLRSILRLTLGGLLGLVVILPDIIDVPFSRITPYYVVGAIAMFALLAVAVGTLYVGHFAARAWTEVVATIVLVVTSMTSAIVPSWMWADEVAVAGFIVFYLFELRGIIRSNPALYAALAIAGVIVVASVAMADSEESAPDAQITTAGAAIAWAVSQVLRAGVLVDVEPVTPAGDVLGFIIILSGVLFTAVFISSITAWAVRQRDSRSAEPIRRQVLLALIDAGLVPDPTAPPDAAAVCRVFVDIDHFVGTRPHNWWRARALATSDALDLLSTADLSNLRPPDGREPHLIAVLEGPSGNLADEPHNGKWPMDLIDAGESADVWLLDHCSHLDLVITTNAHLQARLEAMDVSVDDWSRLGLTPEH
jgi:hypothetical protein